MVDKPVAHSIDPDGAAFFETEGSTPVIAPGASLHQGQAKPDDQHWSRCCDTRQQRFQA